MDLPRFVSLVQINLGLCYMHVINVALRAVKTSELKFNRRFRTDLFQNRIRWHM